MIALLALLAAAPNEAPRLAVMSLSANGVPEAYAAGLTEAIATTITRTEVFETISPSQIRSMLAFEKRRDALGDCAVEECFTQIAKMVRADYLVAGSVAQIGELLTLHFVLIDAEKSKAIQRTEAKADGPPGLLVEGPRAVIALLQPLLTERQGYLLVSSNVPDAQLVVDEELRPEKPGQIVALGAGPHVVRVKRDGFYAATADTRVLPGRVTRESLELIPAKETISEYESKASAIRIAAWITGAVAVGAGVASAVFYAQASDDKEVVDSYTNALRIDQADLDRRASALDAKESFETNQALYLVGLGGAAIAGATSLVLWLIGDDPDRYEAFRGIGE